MRPLIIALSVVVGGCATTAPLSFISGTPATRAEFHLYPVRIVSVDGTLRFQGSDVQIGVDPGVRWLVVEAAPSLGARSTIQKSFAFRVEPCTRYILAAKRDGAMASDWALVIDRKESVAACDRDEELRKAEPIQGSASAASAAR